MTDLSDDLRDMVGELAEDESIPLADIRDKVDRLHAHMKRQRSKLDKS